MHCRDIESVEAPDPDHCIITVLGSTPLTVLTVQLATRGSPTIAPCMGPGGDMVTVKSGTMHKNKSVSQLT